MLRITSKATRYLLSVPFLIALAAGTAVAQASQWVFAGSDGKLQYKILPNPDNPSTTYGDHVMDFSWAGYMGGGVSLPTVPVKQNVGPSGGDDTSAVQAAINAVAALTPDGNGFRGAVLLAPGTFNISSTLNINASGVVLRGSGSGNSGTILNLTGSTGFLAISIQGSGSYSTWHHRQVHLCGQNLAGWAGASQGAGPCRHHGLQRRYHE